jgi:hypothetical protein
MAYSNAIRDVVDGVITPERMMERLEDLFGGG